MMSLNNILEMYNVVHPAWCKTCKGTGIIPVATAISQGTVVGIVLTDCERCKGQGVYVMHWCPN
jgi:DnaJ-class molecular chaperone